MIDNFIYVLTNVILPVFLQIIIGFLLGKYLKAKSDVLVTLQFYILIPAIIFTKLYEFGVDNILPIVVHSILLFSVLYLVAWIVARIRRYSKDKSQAFINSITFYNSGNFSIPLMQTLYTDPIGMTTQVIIMTTQNVLTCTVGIFTSASGKMIDCIKRL